MRQARRIRDLTTAVMFVGWFGNRLKGWLRQTLLGLNKVRATTARRTVALGIEVAVAGKLSRAVFRDFVAPPRRHEFNHVDVLLADTEADVSGQHLPAVVLSEHLQLSVPAFDPASFNPTGWERDVNDRI
ncbi:MAG: hypothetical protein OXG44_09490, partial [Gammaproteobacteria bacterium]|nr:hypothetical protein [Gammaproteobacteria bacterium]